MKYNLYYQLSVAQVKYFFSLQVHIVEKFTMNFSHTGS